MAVNNRGSRTVSGTLCLWHLDQWTPCILGLRQLKTIDDPLPLS